VNPFPLVWWCVPVGCLQERRGPRGAAPAGTPVADMATAAVWGPGHAPAALLGCDTYVYALPGGKRFNPRSKAALQAVAALAADALQPVACTQWALPGGDHDGDGDGDAAAPARARAGAHTWLYHVALRRLRDELCAVGVAAVGTELEAGLAPGGASGSGSGGSGGSRAAHLVASAVAALLGADPEALQAPGGVWAWVAEAPGGATGVVQRVVDADGGAACGPAGVAFAAGVTGGREAPVLAALAAPGLRLLFQWACVTVLVAMRP
jgi:hypothetical protein